MSGKEGGFAQDLLFWFIFLTPIDWRVLFYFWIRFCDEDSLKNRHSIIFFYFFSFFVLYFLMLHRLIEKLKSTSSKDRFGVNGRKRSDAKKKNMGCACIMAAYKDFRRNCSFMFAVCIVLLYSNENVSNTNSSIIFLHQRFF